MSDSTRVSADVSPVCFDVPASLCVCLGCLKKIFFKFWLKRTACRILVLWLGTEPLPPAWGPQRFHHWTAREVLVSVFLNVLPLGVLAVALYGML